MADHGRTAPDDRAKQLFAAALERPAAEQDDFVERSAAGDPRLAVRVGQLLAAYRRAEQRRLLTAPLGPGPGRAPGPAADRRIGPFRVLELLGEGGFGRVYLARQEQPLLRTVAIKVLKPGMDSAQVLARFEAERQALARMEHPGIARILDAGTEATGRPYFVMEYVAGEPVTRWCDARALEVEARLEIFERICFAVHHAHQKGVIHRDLKPTNILVTEHDGASLPKVIDFGIAKAVGEPFSATGTRTGARQLLGTPRYMSPEQAGLDPVDVDTRADIYSLGVVLYELLTGTTPFLGDADAGRDELQRVAHAVPTRPSARVLEPGRASEARAAARRREPRELARRLRGDLDWIAMRALERDRRRRYDSAASLARDIRRHLDHDPVLARRPGTPYLLWKFVQRHQVAVTTAVSVATALVVGLVLAMVGLREARATGDRAQRQLRELYVEQARNARASTRPGRRFLALDAIERAAAIDRGDDLRDEVFACLALPDVELERTAPGLGDAHGAGSRTHDRIAEWAPGSLQFLAAGDGAVVDVLHGVAARPLGVTFDRRGELAAVQVAADRLLVHRLGHADRDLELAFAADRLTAVAFDAGARPPRWLALATSAGAVRLVDLPSGVVRWTVDGAADEVLLASAPDGGQLAVSWPGTSTAISLRATADGAERGRVVAPAPPAALAWSTTGAIAAGCEDMTVRLWDAGTGALRATLHGHQGVVVRLGFDPAGAVLASFGYDNTVRLWDARTGRLLVGPMRDQRLLGIGARLLTVRGDDLLVWRVESAPEVARARLEGIFGAPCAVALRPDGARLATAGDNGVRVWDTAGLAPRAVLHAAPARGVEFVAAGARLVASVDGRLLVWSLDADGAPTGPPVDGANARFDRIDALATDRDAEVVWVVDRGGLHRVDLAARTAVLAQPAYPGMATDPAVSADGRWAFTGTWAGAPAAVWDLTTGAAARRFPGAHVVGAFDPAGRWLCVGDGDEHRLLEVGSWRELWRLRRANTDDLAGPIAFDAAAAVLALGYSRFSTRLVEPATGRLLATVEHPDGVAAFALQFGRDGQSLAAISPARDLLLWDLRAIRARLAALGLDWR